MVLKSVVSGVVFACMLKIYLFIIMSKLCNIHCNNHVSNKCPFMDNELNSIKKTIFTFKSYLVVYDC